MSGARGDAESVVIVVWIVLGFLLVAGVVYDAAGAGDWAAHLAILLVGELVLAGLARAALRVARGMR